MASTVVELKQTMTALAQSADQLGNQLAPYTQKFTEETQKVIAAIGETSTGTDKQVAATLQAASQSLQQTVAALRQVKQANEQWAARA